MNLGEIKYPYSSRYITQEGKINFEIDDAQFENIKKEALEVYSFTDCFVVRMSNSLTFFVVGNFVSNNGRGYVRNGYIVTIA